MFNYFPDNYPWSLTVLVAIENVGTISEIDDAIRPLRKVSGSDLSVQREAWHDAWSKLGNRLESLAQIDEKEKCLLSAARKYFRASIYHLMGERFLSYTDPRQIELYNKGVSNFRKSVLLNKDPVEFIDIPFKEGFLPSLFVKAPVEGPAPCIIHFGGYDSVKEWIYPIMWRPFWRRGIHLLLVDQPGVGGALRWHGLTATPETEFAAGACVDYLESRHDVDPKRIGIDGVSLGGYYAPRAAAFEKRLAACIAWGAIWDNGAIVAEYLKDKNMPRSIPDFYEYGCWVFGANSLEEYFDIMKKLTLEGVADKISCPLLVMHGENDRQIIKDAERKTIEAAVNSPRVDLKVFTRRTGGIEHCHADNLKLGIDYMADWVVDVLGGDKAGIV